MSKNVDIFNKIKKKILSIFSKKEEKKGIDVNKLKKTMDANKEEEKKVKKVIQKKEITKEDLKEKYSRAWMLVGYPDKWFGDKVQENATVNDFLKNLKEGTWEITKALSKNIKIGDKGIIKLGNDTRSKERRTINKIEKEKLDSGVYAVIEFIGIEEDAETFKAKYKIIKNLYKEGKVINKEDSEKILGKVNRTKEIDKGLVENIIKRTS